MDTIRGSLVGEMSLNVLAVAREGLKTVVAQITAAKFQPIEPAALPAMDNKAEPCNKKQEKQFCFEPAKKASGRNRLSLKRSSNVEARAIVRILEGCEPVVSRDGSGDDHSYDTSSGFRHEFEHSYTVNCDRLQPSKLKTRRVSSTKQRKLGQIL